MNKSEQLIACLEGEIAKRDARIVELERYDEAVEREAFEAWHKERYPAVKIMVQNLLGAYTDMQVECNFETWLACAESHSNRFGGALLDASARLNGPPVSEAKAQGVVMPDVNAAAKALCNRHAMICGFDADDQWKEFSQDFIADAETVLANARLTAAPVSSGDPEKCSYQDDPRSPAELSLAGCNCVRFGECNPHWPCKLHTPAAEAGASLIEWTKDAVEWGGALNYAAWEFVNECPEKSALLFNNTKGPLRAAIMKYAEIVSSHRAKGDSHDQ